MNLEAKVATEEAGLLQKLAKVGIPVVFIDFRERPFENSEPSIRLMGKLLGREDRAEDLIAFRREQVEIVQQRLATYPGKRPKVMIERAAGYSDDCCMSFGDENFGRMVKVAGGDNMAANLIPGTFGTVNPEQIVASQSGCRDRHRLQLEALRARMASGSGSDRARTRQVARDTPGDPDAAPALPQPYRRSRIGRVHAIWHQFYDSPYQFVAIQAAGEMASPGAVRRPRPGRRVPGTARSLPARPVQARLLGLREAGS